jgi:hypothetical protein
VPIRLLAGFLALCVLAIAQDARPKNTYHSSGGASTASRIVSPEIHSDRIITFRLRAPKATEVAVQLNGVRPMTKDAAGLWSLTTSPLEPEIYTYKFVVDGVGILDPGNANLKDGRTIDASLFEIPGNPPRFDELQNAPHGALQIRTYTSTPLKTVRHLYVYTPPQYDSDENRRFPVLYLRHGSGDNEENWLNSSSARPSFDRSAPISLTAPSA